MSAEIIRPQFGKSAQNRDQGFAPDLKGMSDLVAEMSLYHAEIRALNGWKSTVTGEPHRFLVFSYTEEYGLDPTARCGIDRAEDYMRDISKNSGEVLLAVTRLAEPFEAQWPREKSGHTLSDFQNDPVDLRFKNADEVVTRAEFGSPKAI